jgi:hypothetical protein
MRRGSGVVAMVDPLGSVASVVISTATMNVATVIDPFKRFREKPFDWYRGLVHYDHQEIFGGETQ